MTPPLAAAARLAKLILDYETAAPDSPEREAALRALEPELWALVKLALARLAGLALPSS